MLAGSSQTVAVRRSVEGPVVVPRGPVGFGFGFDEDDQWVSWESIISCS